MRDSVTARVWQLAEPVVAHEGMEIVDIEFRHEGRGPVLRLYLDREGGVQIDHLSKVSRQLSDLLDVHNAVPGQYTLECSSPGLERRLRLPEHFRRYVGERIRIKLATPNEGRRAYLGTLTAVDDDGVSISEGTGEHRVRYSDIDRANYEPEQPSGGKKP